MPQASTTHWPRVLILWLCGVLAAMQFSKISFTFQALQQHYGVASPKMGLILSTVGMMGLVFGVTVGLFAHAIGYRRLLLVGLGLGAALAGLQSLMLPFGLFWLTRVLEGASQLAVVVAAPTLIVTSAAPQHRSIVMGLWSTFVGVAFALTAALGGMVVARFDVSGLLGLHAAGMALVFVLAWLALRDHEEAAGERHWPQLATLPRLHVQIYTHLATALPGLCFFFYTLMAIALLTFIPQHAGPDRLWLAVVLPLMSTAGTFCAGWLAQYWLSPLRLVRLAFWGVALAGLALWGAAVVGVGYAPASLALLFISGMAGGAGYALIPHLAHEPLQQARAAGAIAQMGNLGSTLGPPLFATAVASLGVTGLALPVVVLALLGIAVASWGARQWAQQAGQ